jgi:hypothetical protein
MCIRRPGGDSNPVTAESDEQRAANEATFREANERIREAQRELDPPVERVPFLCECDDPSCRVPIRLSAEEYERVRTDGTLFVVVAGHSTSDEIVEETDGHSIVRKTGVGGAVAAERDPREEGHERGASTSGRPERGALPGGQRADS